MSGKFHQLDILATFGVAAFYIQIVVHSLQSCTFYRSNLTSAPIRALGASILPHPIIDADLTEHFTTSLTLQWVHNNFKTDEAVKVVEMQIWKALFLVTKVCHFVDFFLFPINIIYQNFILFFSYIFLLFNTDNIYFFSHSPQKNLAFLLLHTLMFSSHAFGESM